MLLLPEQRIRTLVEKSLITIVIGDNFDRKHDKIAAMENCSHTILA